MKCAQRFRAVTVAGVIALAGWLAAGGVATAQVSDSTAGGGDVQQQAISLRELRTHLGDADAATLYGSTWLRGFVLMDDERGKDVVLLTYVEPGRPPVRLEDLAVAYRNVVDGQQRPACTIDPRQETIRKLMSLAQRLQQLTDATAVEGLLAEIQRAATAPQDVRVFGVGAESHFGKIMVEADYYLKSVCNGTEKLAGIVGITPLFMQAAEKELRSKGTLTMPLTVYNRFWFNPGEPAFYRTDEQGTVILGRCPVVLKTEEEAVTPQGSHVGTARPNPIAKQFSERFSDDYKRIARLRPVYRELENLYRLVALADLLVQEVGDSGYAEVVDGTLRQAPVRSYPVGATLPGRYSVEKLEGQVPMGNQTMMYQLWLPSCGGVSIDLHVDQKQNRVRDPEGREQQVKRDVVRSRPSPRAVAWAFRSPSLMQMTN